MFEITTEFHAKIKGDLKTYLRIAELYISFEWLLRAGLELRCRSGKMWKKEATIPFLSSINLLHRYIFFSSLWNKKIGDRYLYQVVSTPMFGFIFIDCLSPIGPLRRRFSWLRSGYNKLYRYMLSAKQIIDIFQHLD